MNVALTKRSSSVQERRYSNVAVTLRSPNQVARQEDIDAIEVNGAVV